MFGVILLTGMPASLLAGGHTVEGLCKNLSTPGDEIEKKPDG